MKKEQTIKIILLLLYYVVLFLLFLTPDVKFPVFDFGVLDSSNIIRLIILLLLLMFPLSILFVSFKKKKVLSIVLSAIIIVSTYFPTGFVFKLQNFYNSYTEDIENYLQHDKSFWYAPGFKEVFPTIVSEEDIYYNYYDYGPYYGIPDSFIMLSTYKSNLSDVEGKLDNLDLAKQNIGQVTYYSTSREIGLYLYAIINKGENSVTYLHITKDNYYNNTDNFNDYIVNNLLYIDSINYSFIKVIFR